MLDTTVLQPSADATRLEPIPTNKFRHARGVLFEPVVEVAPDGASLVSWARFTGDCLFTGKRWATMYYPLKPMADGVQRYFSDGYLMQDAFPFMSPEDRDCLITGLHPEAMPKPT